MARTPRSSQPDFIVAVGRRFQAMRTAGGLSQDDLAAKVGVDKGTLSRFETGASAMSLRKIFDAARVLKVAPAEFLAGTAPLPAIDRVAAGNEAIVAVWARLDGRHRRLLLDVAASFAEASAGTITATPPSGAGGDGASSLAADGVAGRATRPR